MKTYILFIILGNIKRIIINPPNMVIYQPVIKLNLNTLIFFGIQRKKENNDNIIKVIPIRVYFHLIILIPKKPRIDPMIHDKPIKDARGS